MINEGPIKLVRTIPTTIRDINQLMSLLNYRNELIVNKHEYVQDNYLHLLRKINEDIKAVLQL